MRTIFIVAMLLAIPLTSMAQRKNLNKFYRKYKYSEDARKFAIPGFAIKMGAGIARAFVKEPEARAALKFAKRFKKMRFLIMENNNSVRPSDMNYLVKSIKNGKSGYDDFIQVRSGSTRVTFMIREKKDFIKNILILVSEEDQFVMMDMKAKFKIEHLNELLQSLSDEMDVDIPIKKPVKVKKKEKKRV